MTSKEIPVTITPVSLLGVAARSVDATGVLDTLGYMHNLKECNAASMVWNIQAYTSGSHNATLQESDNQMGPFTTVDPMFYQWYLNGRPIAAPVISSLTAPEQLICSYHGGLKRYIQLLVHPVTAGSLTYGIDGLLGLTETQVRAFTNYPKDFADVAWPI